MMKFSGPAQCDLMTHLACCARQGWVVWPGLEVTAMLRGSDAKRECWCLQHACQTLAGAALLSKLNIDNRRHLFFFAGMAGSKPHKKGQMSTPG